MCVRISVNPSYTARRFGRFVAQGSHRKAMTTRSKNLGRVATSSATPSSTRLDESRPLYRNPGALVSNPSVHVPWEEPGLVEVESGWLLFVGVDRKGSAMPESNSPGPDHPRSNRAIGWEKCRQPGHGWTPPLSRAHSCLTWAVLIGNNKTLAIVKSQCVNRGISPPSPCLGAPARNYPWATPIRRSRTCLLSSPEPIRQGKRRRDPRRIHPRPQLKEIGAARCLWTARRVSKRHHWFSGITWLISCGDVAKRHVRLACAPAKMYRQAFSRFNSTRWRALSSYLIENPKYGWLKELGLARDNPGVFTGTWGGNGEVSRLKIIKQRWNRKKIRLSPHSVLQTASL